MAVQQLANEQSEKIQTAGRNLLLYIYSMFKTGELHDLNNDAWLRPSEKLIDVLRELFKYEKRRVTFILYEGTAQVNAHALWLDKSTLETTQELEQFLAQREIGGVIFREVPREDAVKQFFYRVSRFRPDESAASQTKVLTDQLVQQGVSSLAVAPRPNRLDQVGTGVRGVKAIWTYSKSVAAFTEVYNRRPVEVRKARRLIQEIVDANTNEQDLMIALAFSAGERNVERISVDVAVICAAIGRGLGLSRSLCSDLAMAGLLSDIGGAYLTERESGVNQSIAIPGLTFRQLAEGSSLTQSFLNRIGVAMEWSSPLREPEHQLDGQPPMLPMSALIRAVRVLLNKIHGVSGVPMTAHGALKYLTEEARSVADKQAASMVALTVGFLPVGSVVRLQNDDLGVVSEIDHIRGPRAFSSVELPMVQARKVYVTRFLNRQNREISEREARVCLGESTTGGEWTVKDILSGLGLEQFVLRALFANPLLVKKQLGLS